MVTILLGGKRHCLSARVAAPSLDCRSSTAASVTGDQPFEVRDLICALDSSSKLRVERRPSDLDDSSGQIQLQHGGICDAENISAARGTARHGFAVKRAVAAEEKASVRPAAVRAGEGINRRQNSAAGDTEHRPGVARTARERGAVEIAVGPRDEIAVGVRAVGAVKINQRVQRAVRADLEDGAIPRRKFVRASSSARQFAVDAVKESRQRLLHQSPAEGFAPSTPENEYRLVSGAASDKGHAKRPLPEIARAARHKLSRKTRRPWQPCINGA